MAATNRAAATKIAARCRRIGWQVETGTGRQPFHYRIILPTPLPDGAVKVDVHRTPSDTNWEEHVWRVLNNAGFDQAEQQWLAGQEARRQAKLDEDRRKVDAKTKKLEAESAARVKAAGVFAGPQPVDLAWLLTPTKFPETRTVVISPEVARKVLDSINTHNRPLRQGHVDWIKQIIEDDEWAPTHQGGAIDWDGTLQDGQHRLEAIWQTGVSVPMMWTVGMDPKFFGKVDTNKTRNARDTAYIRGETDPGPISATAKMLVVVDRFGPDAHVKYKSHKVTNDTVDRAIEAMGDPLRAAVRDAKELKKEFKKLNPSAMAAAIYLIRQRLPENDLRVAKFLYDLRYGENILKGDPVWHLRRLLFNSVDARRGYNAWETLAYVLKTWNERARGKMDMKQLVWQASTSGFPAVIFLPPPLTPQQRAELVAGLPAQLRAEMERDVEQGADLADAA